MAHYARKFAALALSSTVALTAFAPAAQADHRYRSWERVHIIERGHAHRPHRKHYRKHHRHHRKHYRHARKHRNNDTAAAVALGIGAIALGAIIAGAANDRSRTVYHQPHNAYPPQPVYRQRRGSGYSTIEPWTAAWYDYCADRYRSFNPATGTFRGYDGYDHFCVAR